MPYIKHTKAFDILLSNGCGEPEDFDEHVAANREGRVSKSIYRYKIALHCFDIVVRARQRKMGKWNPDAKRWIEDPTYGVISIEIDPESNRHG